MSDVISFRLNKENPRERQALEILEAWCSRGYSVRYVISEALLRLISSVPESTTNDSFLVLIEELQQINGYIKELKRTDLFLSSEHYDNQEPMSLSDNFIQSAKKAMKPGITS